jgi:hypothetical protein
MLTGRRLAIAAGLIGLCTLGFAARALAQEGGADLTVDQIVEKANQVAYYQGGTGKARVKMTIFTNEGKVRGQRELVILRRNADEGLNQKMYAYIEAPADVRGTVFLVWKQTEKDDDRWLYNPALDYVNRIAATDKRSSFVGTHFLYEDVSGRNIDDDEHELVQTTKDYYVLKNTPKDKDVVEFGHYVMYIHRATFLPVAAHYFDKNGEKYREYQVLKMDRVDGYITPTQTVMRDLRDKSDQNVAQTVAEYSDVKYGIDLPENIFTERFLRKPPREQLQ